MSNHTNAPQPAAAPDAVGERLKTATGTTPPPGSGASASPDDRRKRNIPVATDRRRAENAAAKRKSSERRRLIDPTTCERDYSDEETEFMKAMDRVQSAKTAARSRRGARYSKVLRSLGYRRTEDADRPPRARAGHCRCNAHSERGRGRGRTPEAGRSGCAG